mmetsp:Transcript_514/g.1098  ORF Transcript_514/g.1098 Transcript_514/m.1098 type:complete len:278 (-) Transcript_514:63-896(-)
MVLLVIDQIPHVLGIPLRYRDRVRPKGASEVSRVVERLNKGSRVLIVGSDADDLVIRELLNHLGGADLFPRSMPELTMVSIAPGVDPPLGGEGDTVRPTACDLGHEYPLQRLHKGRLDLVHLVPVAQLAVLPPAKGVHSPVLGDDSRMEASARHLPWPLPQQCLHQPRRVAVPLGPVAEPTEFALPPCVNLPRVRQASRVKPTGRQLNDSLPRQPLQELRCVLVPLCVPVPRDSILFVAPRVQGPRRRDYGRVTRTARDLRHRQPHKALHPPWRRVA